MFIELLDDIMSLIHARHTTWQPFKPIEVQFISSFSAERISVI